MVMKSANLAWNIKLEGGQFGWMALKHALEMWTSKEEEKKRERGRVASKHGGGCGVRGESSGEVGKSVKRWTWEGELVTSSGVDFTAPVALILTSRPPLGKLRLSPPPQPPTPPAWGRISSHCWRCHAEDKVGGVSAFIWLKLMIKKGGGTGRRGRGVGYTVIRIWVFLSQNTHCIYCLFSKWDPNQYSNSRRAFKGSQK